MTARIRRRISGVYTYGRFVIMQQLWCKAWDVYEGSIEDYWARVAVFQGTFETLRDAKVWVSEQTK